MPELQHALPKFLQIANHIRDQILSGALSPGDEVPSERLLAEEWRVSRPTATRALQALRSQGLIESRQGAGSFVRDRHAFNRRARDRYAHSRADGRVYPRDEWAEIVSAELADPPREVADSLGVASGARAVRRRRVIRNDDGPIEVATSWFEASIVDVAPRLLVKERIREGTLAYVEGCTGRRAKTACDQLGARLANEEEVNELDLRHPQAVLVVFHVAFDAGGRPLEVAEAVYPPNGWAFEQEY